MSGPNRQKNPNQAHQDEHSYQEEERSRRASLPTGQRRLSGAAPSLEELRTQELMVATMLDQHPSRASLTSFSATRAASMASNQMDASILARLAHQQQQQQQHSLLERYHFQQHQQAAEQQVKAQQDEMEFNSLLLRKRQIDEMLLNSALSTRRLSMESALPPSLYNPPGAAGLSNLPVQMGSAAAAAAMMGSAGGAGGASLGNHNISNRPILGDTDALSGKISAAGLESGRAAFWAEQNRRYSDPQQAARMRMMMGTPGLGLSATSHSSGLSQDHGGLEEEEDDETYFNDTGADEVDRDFKRSQENFPLKLYRIIYEVVKSGRGDVISFFPHGRAFAVHKPKEFISEIMPKYFATGRMNTFLKQLNLYSFRRITEGRDKGGYFHPQFIHGKRHLCKQIKRKKTESKPAASKAKSLVVTGAGETKEGERRNKPVSTEAYASSLSKKIQKQRQQGEAKSPPGSPSSSRHPKMRWKNSQEGR